MGEQIKDSFCPSLCVTHNCNLNCVYCYQQHDTENRMDFETAKTSVDWIFDNVPLEKNAITLTFIGGEPLLEFNLIKEIVKYVRTKKSKIPVKFFATTNGTVFTEEMKAWFEKHRSEFVLSLSLDGTKKSHDINRSYSFDDIDIAFFRNNWPYQGVKMTISEQSLNYLAENIIFIHEFGFNRIDGVNLFEGAFDWNKDRYIKILVPQLKTLTDYYLENPQISVNQMFRKNLEMCALKSKERRKYCGIGTNMVFFDTDGKRYPCAFTTPMTFGQDELRDILKTDFYNDNNFIDQDCYNNCYIYPICSTCAGANYLENKTFGKRSKEKCRINKLIALFVADLYSKRIIRYPELYTDETLLYYIIESIKNIKKLYLEEFFSFLQ